MTVLYSITFAAWLAWFIYSCWLARRLLDAEAALRISRINAESLEIRLRIAEKRAAYHNDDATFWREKVGLGPSGYSAHLDPSDVDACKEPKP